MKGEKMKVRILAGLLLVTGLMVIGVSIYAQAFPRPHPDDYVFDGRIVQIKGKVTILNHPELGVTPASFTGIVFRREGCRDCLVVVNTDENGKYQVSLGQGRYRVIMRGGSGGLNPTYDMIAPDQPRIVEARRSPYPTEFDIRVAVPRD
jgi:hypothetical protein